MKDRWNKKDDCMYLADQPGVASSLQHTPVWIWHNCSFLQRWSILFCIQFPIKHDAWSTQVQNTDTFNSKTVDCVRNTVSIIYPVIGGGACNNPSTKHTCHQMKPPQPSFFYFSYIALCKEHSCDLFYRREGCPTIFWVSPLAYRWCTARICFNFIFADLIQ